MDNLLLESLEGLSNGEEILKGIIEALCLLQMSLPVGALSLSTKRTSLQRLRAAALALLRSFEPAEDSTSSLSESVPFTASLASGASSTGKVDRFRSLKSLKRRPAAKSR